MRSLVVCLLTALAVVVLPQLAAAQPPDGPQRPGPERMLKHLDKDGDGVISADEAAKLPERAKAMLKRADADDDKKVTGEELKAAFAKIREKFAGKGRPGPDRGKGRPGPPCAKDDGPRRHGPPGTHRGSGRRPGPPGPGFKKPDPKEVFARLDKDDDEQLSLEEFTEGMERFREGMKRFHEAFRHGRPHMHHHGGPCPRPGVRGPGRPGIGPPVHRPGMHRRGPGGPGRGPEAMRQRFKAADKNDDGKLSKEEAPERLKAHFDKIDADGDGQLTPEELRESFKAMVEKMRAKGGAGPGKKAPEKKPEGKKSASEK